MTRRRTLAALWTAVTVLGLAAGGVAVAPVAQAHGAPTSPGSRTYLCYTDGHWTGGDLQPRNAACRAAVAKGGKQPLWDWFGVLRGDGAGRTRGFVPNGKLCSGGSDKYAAYDLARADWPVTHLTAGARFTFRHNAWAPHPGVFTVWVTKDGYDPTAPLTWDSLEAKPFSRWTETTPNGNGEYRWTATLPAGKTGRHVVYTVWSRTDSKETFYACSDVVFDGGHGQVTGFPDGPGGGDPQPAPEPEATRIPPAEPGQPAPAATTKPRPSPRGTATTVAAPSNPSASSGQAGAEGAGTAGTDAGQDAPTVGGRDPGCRASLSVRTWPGGYLATVAVLNTGAVRRGWSVGLTVPEDTAVVSGVNADVTASGTALVAAARPENPDLAAGEQVSVGYVATGRPPLRSAVTLGGVRCAVVRT